MSEQDAPMSTWARIERNFKRNKWNTLKKIQNNHLDFYLGLDSLIGTLGMGYKTHDVTKHKDTQNDTQNNDIQNNDTQNNGKHNNNKNQCPRYKWHSTLWHLFLNDA